MHLRDGRRRGIIEFQHAEEAVAVVDFLQIEHTVILVVRRHPSMRSAGHAHVWQCAAIPVAAASIDGLVGTSAQKFVAIRPSSPGWGVTTSITSSSQMKGPATGTVPPHAWDVRAAPVGPGICPAYGKPTHDVDTRLSKDHVMPCEAASPDHRPLLRQSVSHTIVWGAITVDAAHSGQRHYDGQIGACETVIRRRLNETL